MRLRSGLVLIAVLAIAALFLWQEHKAHLLGALPFVLLLLCPLLHMFHGGQGGMEVSPRITNMEEEKKHDGRSGLRPLVFGGH